MSLRSSLGLFLLVLCLAPCAAPAQVTKTGNAYLLRMKLVKGASYSFEVSIMATVGAAKPVPVSMGYSLLLEKVTKGVADVLMTMKSPMSEKPETMKVKMDGRGMVDLDPGMEQMGGIRLPEKALKVGESWKSSQKVDAGASGAMSASTVYTFTGVQSVGKVPCAVLDVKTTGTGAFASTTTGKMYIEMSSGMLFQSNLVSSVTMNMGGKPQTYKSTATIKRK